MRKAAGDTVTVRLGVRIDEPIRVLVFDQPHAVHALVGWDDGHGFVTDRSHELTADCACGPRLVSRRGKPRWEHLGTRLS